jgi:hypothetical protein
MIGSLLYLFGHEWHFGIISVLGTIVNAFERDIDWQGAIDGFHHGAFAVF